MEGANQECIEWRGDRTTRGGYGVTPYRVRVRGGEARAHRWAYIVFYGPIPKGAVIMHTCDNPPCVNPLHLRSGTQQDNMRDAARKGRCSAGQQKAETRLKKSAACRAAGLKAWADPEKRARILAGRG